MDYVMHSLLIGSGATALLDLWSLARYRLFNTPLPDYDLVGRWFAYMSRGTFRHAAISRTPAVRGERLIGWTAHYLVGIAFAGVLLAIWGLDWARQPVLGPALLVGVGSVVAPFLFMQPGMGAGVAASRTPQPGAARLRSLVTHTVFGFGLYLAGLASSPITQLLR
jgi:hypothetical protein